MVQKTHEIEASTLRAFDTISLEVKIKYAVLVAGLVLTLLFSYSYVFFSPPGLPPNDVIRNIILIVGAGIGLTSVIYTALSVNAIRADKVKEAYTAKLLHSSQFVSAWYSPSMTSHTTKIREYALKLIGEQDISKRRTLIHEITDNHDLYVSVVSVLNFLEHMAQEINYNLVDEVYLRSFFRQIVHLCYHSFLELIRKIPPLGCKLCAMCTTPRSIILEVNKKATLSYTCTTSSIACQT